MEALEPDGPGVFTRIMSGLAAEAADEKTIMIGVEPGQRHWLKRPGDGYRKPIALPPGCG